VRPESWPKDRWSGMAAFLSQMAYKPTIEWKEEIVLFDLEKARSQPGMESLRAAAFPDATVHAVLDCAAAPGAALAALRAGFKLVVFDLTHPAAASVLGAAAEAGAEVLGARPAALDLGTLDPRRRDDERRIAALFATVPPQDQPS
jgi:hypothetical protein